MRKKMDIFEAADLLKVSESTVRRIFARLDQDGKVIRTHGGVTLIEDSGNGYSFELLSLSHYNEKKAIGEKAYSLIKEGDVIYVDASTTVFTLCLSIAEELKSKPINVRIFTNSLPNLEALLHSVPVTLIGGDYRPNRKDFAGYISEITLSQLYFNKCFMGTDGYNKERGFTTTDFDTAKLNQIVANNSDNVIVLCDSSKFNTCSVITCIKSSQVNRVITDSGIDNVTYRNLRSDNIAVDIVQSPNEVMNEE